jgi:hypothetical protein
MNSIQKSFALAAVAVFGLALAPAAGARSTPAWAGAPNPLTASNCFTESYGRVTNSACNSQQTWEVALPVDAGGTWTVTANVTPTSDPSSVHCIAYAVNESASSFWASPVIYANQASVAQNIALTVSGVPGGGALFLGCFLNEGAAVNTVNWNQ